MTGAFLLTCFGPQSALAQDPSISTVQAFELESGTVNEEFATLNQAMNVWRSGAATPGKELLVALIHRYNNLDQRADDEEFIVAWESDGETMTEVQRIPTACPNVELTVPTEGPYVFESRLDYAPGLQHPECSCVAVSGYACPRGVVATPAGGTPWNALSPTYSHFVRLENEFEEYIRDPGTMYLLKEDVEAAVRTVDVAVPSRTAAAPVEDEYGCAGSWDDVYGSVDVTEELLRQEGMVFPDGYVTDKWCLVKRGGCSETSKVKVCQASGAAGTIIYDHGFLENDQEILIRYNRAARETATTPTLFLNRTEGEELVAQVAAWEVRVAVGPTIEGPSPPGYHEGSGITVHMVGNVTSGATETTKHYPDLFATAGWIEASDTRELLFVCITSQSEVRIYDISDPMTSLPLLGTIGIPCSSHGMHDYRIIDYFGTAGRHSTVLVDPWDYGNRLFYYDTEDPSAPVLEHSIRVTMEDRSHGLGQVRPGGAEDRFHIATWHCSSLFCGKNHGDSLHILDTWLMGVADPDKHFIEVKLPMMSKGSFARDVACNSEHLCLVTLSWDGLVAFDSGVSGTQNFFGVVATIPPNEDPFDDARIPNHRIHYRLYAGAQKAYVSKLFPRKWYVEHATYSDRHLRTDDPLRALQLRHIYVAEVLNYDATVNLGVATVLRSPSERPPPPDDLVTGAFTVMYTVAVEEGSENTTVGYYFFFDLNSEPGLDQIPDRVWVRQHRGEALIWSGYAQVRRNMSNMSMLGGANACPSCNAYGWRELGPAEGQWVSADKLQVPEVLRPWEPEEEEEYVPPHSDEGATLRIVLGIAAALTVLSAFVAAVMGILYYRALQANKVVRIQLNQLNGEGGDRGNIVVGRPVGPRGSEGAEAGAASGAPLGNGMPSDRKGTHHARKMYGP